MLTSYRHKHSSNKTYIVHNLLVCISSVLFCLSISLSELSFFLKVWKGRNHSKRKLKSFSVTARSTRTSYSFVLHLKVKKMILITLRCRGYLSMATINTVYWKNDVVSLGKLIKCAPRSNPTYFIFVFLCEYNYPFFFTHAIFVTFVLSISFVFC